MMIYQHFSDIADRFDTLLVDVYGVFWDGTSITPNARETLSAEVQKGKPVCILSNSSTTNPDSATKGLIRGVHYTEVITSGMLLNDLLKSDALPILGHNIYVLGHSKFDLTVGTPFRLVDRPEDADFVYFGTPRIRDITQYPLYQKNLFKTSSDLYDTTTADIFIPDLQYCHNLNLPAISTNPDLVAAEMGHWVIRQGTLVEIYQRLGGTAFEYGKPHTNIYDYAFQKLKIKPSPKVAMIGDTYRTDIRGALNYGISPVWCLDSGVAHYELMQGKSLLDQAGGSLEDITLIHQL